MTGPSFNDFISKFKTSTKQAADQMGRAAKIAKLKMDIMTLTGERVRFLQAIGAKTYQLYHETNGLDSNMLIDRVRSDLSHIERIDERITEIENEIKDQQAIIQNVEIRDVTEQEEETSQGESKEK